LGVKLDIFSRDVHSLQVFDGTESLLECLDERGRK